jgi:hypothetical protein
MRQPIPASEFIELGKSVEKISTPKYCLKSDYIQMAGRFLQRLSTSGLPTTHKVALLFEGTIPNDGGSGISPPKAQELAGMMKLIDEALILETSAKRMICLDVDGVSSQLRALDKVTLTAAQKLLLEETITCIECEAYHAATVMGWNLAFDCIRFWIFTNHLTAFNTLLVANYLKRNGSAVYTPINDYGDFYAQGAPSERIVLDVALEIKAFGGVVYDHLCQYLRQRNNSAHPTAKAPTRDQTNAYIENLIDIITGAPFK